MVVLSRPVAGGSSSRTKGLTLRRISSQSLADSTINFIEFDTVVRDDLNGAWSVSTPEQVVIPVNEAGWYVLSGGIYRAENNIDEQMIIFIEVNDDPQVQARMKTNGVGNPGDSVCASVYLNDGDVIKLGLFNGGSNRSTYANDSPYTFLSLCKCSA